MTNIRNIQYKEILADMIRIETVSVRGTDNDFSDFRSLLKKHFPSVFSHCEEENFGGSLLLKWKGAEGGESVLFMNHHDVVEATGNWTFPPFSATDLDGTLYGRGTLDTKGGLFAMLMAAEELINEGFTPKCDIYFYSDNTEEIGGPNADAVSTELKSRGLHFKYVLDEGGMIVDEPISGAKGKFAMIGVGEKGYADLKFTARSRGGHSSTPPKDTPLVRLGKFMAEADKGNIFDVEIAPVIHEMFSRLGPTMDGALKPILKNSRLFSPILKKALPAVSSTAGALTRTTLAFTMCHGSGAYNVIPEEAYVTGNMRYSHHQGAEASIKAVTELAAKYGIETELIAPTVESHLSSHTSVAFKNIESAVGEIFPDVISAPYIMTGGSDARYMSRVSEYCYRFVPFMISKEQMASVHGIDENVDISTLAPAVDFYKIMMKKE